MAPLAVATRERLLDEAERLFARGGVQGVTTRQITEAAEQRNASAVTYHFRSPERGDVIVFHPPGYTDAVPLIKRVVAVGGDTVSVHDCKLWLNGVAQDEPYLK